MWCWNKEHQRFRVRQVFPYINKEGIETATFTDNKSEGWIDPFLFHTALKSKAIEQGAEFVKGEVKSLSEINAKTIVSAAGCWTKELLEDIPVEPQKHTVFRVKCPKHIPEMPLTGDLTTGVYWRPEGKEYLVWFTKISFWCHRSRTSLGRFWGIGLACFS